MHQGLVVVLAGAEVALLGDGGLSRLLLLALGGEVLLDDLVVVLVQRGPLLPQVQSVHNRDVVLVPLHLFLLTNDLEDP